LAPSGLDFGKSLGLLRKYSEVVVNRPTRWLVLAVNEQWCAACGCGKCSVVPDGARTRKQAGL